MWTDRAAFQRQVCLVDEALGGGARGRLILSLGSQLPSCPAPGANASGRFSALPQSCFNPRLSDLRPSPLRLVVCGFPLPFHRPTVVSPQRKRFIEKETAATDILEDNHGIPGDSRAQVRGHSVPRPVDGTSYVLLASVSSRETQ